MRYMIKCDRVEVFFFMKIMPLCPIQTLFPFNKSFLETFAPIMANLNESAIRSQLPMKGSLNFSCMAKVPQVCFFRKFSLAPRWYIKAFADTAQAGYFHTNPQAVQVHRYSEGAQFHRYLLWKVHFHRYLEGAHFHKYPEGAHCYRYPESAHFHRHHGGAHFYRHPEDAHFHIHP
jgi:hypothetical protein